MFGTPSGSCSARKTLRLAIVLATLALLAVIDDARDQRFPVEPEPARAADAAEEAGKRALDSVATHDASGTDFLLGIYNSIAPFVSRLIFDGDLLLALPLRLPSPWWLTSIAVRGRRRRAAASRDR